jgi:hypothetical protein
VGANRGEAPTVRVFDSVTGQEWLSFLAFDPTFNGGVTVILEDVTMNGTPEIVATSNRATRVFDLATGQLIADATGDINLDGEVGFTDFVVLANNFNKPNATRAEGDLNGNGTVDFPDFVLLSSNFGRSAAPTLDGDIDMDGEVGFTDFVILVNNFNKPNATASEGDLDGDGFVNFLDFLIFADNYGRVAGSSAALAGPLSAAAADLVHAQGLA